MGGSGGGGRQGGQRGTPERLVVVFGTGTGVGKTWIGTQVLGRLRSESVTVAARKPVQSFGPGDGATDAELLAGATGESPGEVCPAHRSYEEAMAPPVAARALGREPFGIADLVAETVWPLGIDVGWVETVGGPRSPLAADGDSAALAGALRPDLAVLVAEAGLGAINAVRLSAAALEGLGCTTVVVLNRYDGSALHRSNRDWLGAGGLAVLTDLDDLAARVR